MGDINDLDDHEPVEVKKTEEPKKKKKVDEDGNEIKEPVEAYKLLGLEDKGFDATTEEIKKAFRKLSLQYHPDKVAANGLDPEEAEAQYKLIQEANEILTTPELKILFDSDVKNLPKGFDKIPSEDFEGDFYEVFGEAFKRFSRWSEDKLKEDGPEVPLLGDANTPMEQVDAFYDYWYEFKSWRIQTGNPKEEGDGEHDPSNAEDAYERRWMKTENERERKKLKKEHMKKIGALRDLAFSKDPRVIAAKKEQFAAAEAEKQKKLEAKLAKQAEEKAKADAGKTPAELAKEKALEEKKEAERAKAEEAANAKKTQAEEDAAQAARVQAAIKARQQKMKDAKAGAPKKAPKKDDKKKKDKKK